MTMISYILLLIFTTALELWVSVGLLDNFAVDTIKSGYKINLTHFKKIVMKEYKSNIIDYILQLIPGFNVTYFFFRIKHTLKKLKRNPEFIANLTPLHPVDKALIGECLDGKDIHSMVERFLTYYTMCEDVSINHEKVDVETITKKELKNNGFTVTKEVIDKMVGLDEKHDDNKIVNKDKSFYTLPGDYSLSNVYKLDENAIFIKTSKGTHIAIVNATESDLDNLSSSLLEERPSIDIMYHIVSLRPFAKDKIRTFLFEIEYNKELNTSPIDVKFKPVNQERKRVL